MMLKNMRSLFILVTLVFSGTFFAESTMQCNFKNELGESLDEKILDFLNSINYILLKPFALFIDFISFLIL